MGKTGNIDILQVYSNLRKGSINHLNAYVRNLQQNGFETDLDWEQYTNQEALEEHGHGRSGERRGRGSRGGQGQRQGRR